MQDVMQDIEKILERLYIVVFGNEKGGTGKSTTAIHTVMGLLYNGHRIASVDLDSRQRSMTNFFENRNHYIETHDIDLPFPYHYIVNKSHFDEGEKARQDELERFHVCLNKAVRFADCVIIDAPGNDTYLSRLAHSYADMIITPINDSFVDLNVIAKMEGNELHVDVPGIYSEVIWEAKLKNAKKRQGEIEWFVLRNRLTHINAHNKHNMTTALNNLAKRMGCKIIPGFTERVIYRELFLQGLSLLDIANHQLGLKMNLSHVAARQELRTFMDSLGIEDKILMMDNQPPHLILDTFSAKNRKKDTSTLCS